MALLPLVTAFFELVNLLLLHFCNTIICYRSSENIASMHIDIDMRRTLAGMIKRNEATAHLHNSRQYQDIFGNHELESVCNAKIVYNKMMSAFIYGGRLIFFSSLALFVRRNEAARCVPGINGNQNFWENGAVRCVLRTI